MSYPDLIEEDGKFYVTETQKNVGRVHEIPLAIVEGLFRQWDNRTVATQGLVLDLPGKGTMPRQTPMPRLPEFHQRDVRSPDHRGKDLRAGFSLDLRLKFTSLEAGQEILDSRDAAGKGILVSTTAAGTLRITLNDGRSESSWECDPGVLAPGKTHQVAIIVDGGPKIIMFVVDGLLCDGGDHRQFGWGRFSPHLRAPNPDPPAKDRPPLLRIAPKMNGSVESLRIYNRALRTSEAVGNWRAAAD